MLSSLSAESANPPPQYLSVVPSDRALIEKHSPGALAPSQELKYRHDFPLRFGKEYSTMPWDVAAVQPPEIYWNDEFFQTSVGTGPTQRIGRTATVHLWSLRMRFTCGHTSRPTFPTQPVGGGPEYRLIIGVDHQPTALPLTPTSAADALLAPMPAPLIAGGYDYLLRALNPVTEQRFTVLYDKVRSLGEAKTRDSFIEPSTQQSVTEYYSDIVEFKTVLKLKCNFNDGAALPYDERLFVFAYLPQALPVKADAINTWTTLNSCSFVRFTD